MDDLKNPITSINFKGLMRATVIKRDDDKLGGRVGVNIHKLMPDEDHTNIKEKESIETPKQKTNFFSSESEVKPSENEQIKYKNFYWARPSFRFSNNSGKTSGSYIVPQIGEVVVVYFEDNDPQKCRYLPLCVVKDGEMLLELEKTFNKDILADPVKKPNIEVITKTPNNNIIGFDYNEETNQFIIKFDPGDIISITNNKDVDEIYLQTADKSYVRIDGKKHVIETSTKESKVTIDGENNTIESVTKNTKTKLDGTKNDITTTSDETNINSSSKLNINSSSNNITGVSNFLSQLNANQGLSIIGAGLLNGKNILVDANSGSGSGGSNGGSGGGSNGGSGNSNTTEVDLTKYLIKNENIEAGTKTKITYDSKGLVIKGEDLSTSDINETNDKKFINNSMFDYLLDRLNSNGSNNTGVGKINSSLYISDTKLLTNDMIINHNINFFVKVEFFTDTNEQVIANYVVVDSNNILIKLEEDYIGYVMIYRVG